MRVLHIAPHPDDEILGAGATLLALRDGGHAVSNLALSLGRRQEQARRRIELEEACERLGLPLEVLEPPLAMSGGDGDDLDAARRRLTAELAGRITAVDLVVCPSPHDAHPGHALVGRAAFEAADTDPGDQPRLWLWSLWSSLPLPTTITGFGEPELLRLEAALQAHRSQLERNSYRTLLRAKATVEAVLGPERVLGFGAEAIASPFAELTCELVRVDRAWLLGAPRALDREQPLAAPTQRDARGWLEAPSASELLREPG